MEYKREIDDMVMIQYIILFTLATANRYVTHNQLTSIVLEHCNINFAAFQIALDNLEKIGHVRLFRPDEKTVICELLPKGREANDFFKVNIPIYVREPIEQSILPFFQAEELRKSVQAEIVPLNEQEFSVSCKVLDGRTLLMDLTFYAGTRAMAAKMAQYFKKNPDAVYGAVLRALTPPEVSADHQDKE